MPNVIVETNITAPIGIVWQAITDVESYPHFMPSVRDVKVLAHGVRERTSKWSVLLKGSILQWTEQEWLEPELHRLTFEQLEGDLDVFRGYWSLQGLAPGIVEATLAVEFEIGIPLLADMLNPVAARALHDNSMQMLHSLESHIIPS